MDTLSRETAIKTVWQSSDGGIFSEENVSEKTLFQRKGSLAVQESKLKNIREDTRSCLPWQKLRKIYCMYPVSSVIYLDGF